MSGFLQRLLAEPALQGLDPNAAEYTIAHRHILSRKRAARALFTAIYHRCRLLDLRHFGQVQGVRVELGTGAGFAKDIYPDIVTSDMKRLPFVDLVATAEAMPFRSGVVRAVHAINVFHHLPNPRSYFRELSRVLAPGGGAVMVEPYHGLFARLLYARLFSMESYEPDADAWETPLSGPATGANQALSYVVFTRDRPVFEQEFPNLEVVCDTPHSHVGYIASGGLNFRQVLPDALVLALLRLEESMPWLNRWLGLLHTIVLRKRMGP